MIKVQKFSADLKSCSRYSYNLHIFLLVCCINNYITRTLSYLFKLKIYYESYIVDSSVKRNHSSINSLLEKI